MKEKLVQLRLVRYFNKEVVSYLKLCADFERRIAKDRAVFQEQLDLKRKELEKMVGGSLAELGIELPVLVELPATPAVAPADILGKTNAAPKSQKTVKKSRHGSTRGDFLNLVLSAVPPEGIKPAELKETLLSQGAPRHFFKGNWYSRLHQLVRQGRLRLLKNGTYKPATKL
ncbi:MAG: hypothetical protein HY372_02350 [Candidatus Andersenbacteria bacterium]|nr:hypothetical protein [Candidatus Andersenbacteria bacterium]